MQWKYVVNPAPAYDSNISHQLTITSSMYYSIPTKNARFWCKQSSGSSAG